MRLIYNSDAQRIQKDFDDKTPTSVSEMLRAERTSSVPLELFLVDSDGGYATPGTSDYEVVIGRSAQELTTGLLKLTWTGTTEAIDLSKPKLATRIESALNAVAEIDTAGGVDVVGLTNGRGYQITFRSVGSRAAITAGVSESMQPATATLTEVTAGDMTTKEVQLLTLEEASLAEVSTSSWSASSAPTLTISTLVAGTSSTREVQKLSISGDPAPGSFFVVSDSEPISTEATAAQVKTILNSALSSDIGSVKKTGEREWQVTYKTNGDKAALSAGTHNLVRRPGISATLSLNTTALAYASNSDGSDLSIGFTLRKSNEVIISEKISLSEPFAEVLGSTAMLTNDSIGALFSIDGDEINKGQAITISGGLTYSSHTLAAPFLPLAGGTMTGAVAMGSQKITGLADGTASADAINKGQLDDLIDNAPAALNTLNELAAALGDDVNFSTTVATNIATKLPLAGGTMTGPILNADGSAAAPSISFSSDSDTGFYYSGSVIYGAFNTQNRWKFSADYIGSADTNAARMSRAVGSAASPSFTFINNENTGMFRADADTLAFSTAGTETFRIDSSGDLHMRSGNKLHLYAGGENYINFENFQMSSGTALTINNEGAGGINLQTGGTTRLAIDNAGLSTFYGGIKISQGTPMLELYDNSSGTSGNIKVDGVNMSIINGGNDGDLILECDNGSNGVTQYLRLDGDEEKVIFSKPITVGADTDGHDVKFFGNTSGSYMLWDESTDDLILGGDSKLGIGTATPSTVLELSASGANGIDISEDAAQANQSGRLFFSNDTSSQGVALMNSVGSLKFQTGAVPNSSSGTTRMTLNATGNLGIGTTTPAEKLEIDGNIKLSGSLNVGGYIHPNDEDGNLRIYGGNDTTNDAQILLHGNSNSWGSMELNYGYDATNSYLKIKQGSTEHLRITNGGKVGISTTSPSSNADLTLGGGELCMAETTTPTADANFGKVYTKSDNKLYFQDGAGTEHEIAFA